MTWKVWSKRKTARCGGVYEGQGEEVQCGSLKMSRFTAEIIKGRRASWSKDGCVTYSLHTLEPFTLDLFLQSMNKALNSSIPSRLHGQSLKQRTCSCSNAYSPLTPVLDESGRILMLETGQKAECVMVTAAQDRRY